MMPLATQRTSSWLFRVGAVAAILLLGACSTMGASSGHRTAAIPQGPAGASFYTPPNPLPAGKHGDLIWARKLTDGAALPSAAQNWLVLYRSTNLAGQPIAVSGTVAIPKGTPPKGGWPVISWTHGTTGIADVCAPSKMGPHYLDRGYVGGVNKILDKWVQKGYAVLKTDYQGLGTPGTHPYLNGYSEARGATDIVLAARQLDPQLSRNWLVMGHSQGGQAALYTAYLGPIYAQNLNMKGAVAISPASDLSVQVAYLLKQRNAKANAFLPLILVGTAASAPGVNVSSLLTPEGQKQIKVVDHGCMAAFRAPGGWSSFKNKDLIKAKANFKPLLGAITSLDNAQNLRPSVPLLVLQAVHDHIVLKQFTDLTVWRYKDLGADVDYITYPDIHGHAPSVHRATVPRSLHDAMHWVEQHLPSGR